MKIRFEIPVFCLSTVLSVAALCSASAQTFDTNAVADAFVATGPTGNLRNNNYGGGGALIVAAPDLSNGEFQTVIKFDLSGAQASFNAAYGAGLWSVRSASLQLTATAHGNAIYNAIAAGHIIISLMQNSSWVEGTGNASSPTSNGISYNTLFSNYVDNATDQSLGTFAFSGTTGIDTFPLTLASSLVSDVLSGTLMTLRLYAADNSVSAQFNSRENSPESSDPILNITAAPQPRIANVSASGGALIIQGTNGLANGTYYVLASSNLALSLTNWSAVGTNTFDSSGNFSFTNTIAPGAPQQFYLLEFP